MTYKNRTIAAIATPPGKGGIAIVRLSGPQAKEIVLEMFRQSSGAGGKQNPATSQLLNHSAPELMPYRLHHGFIADLGIKSDEQASARIIDEVLVAYMKYPESYTGEDVVEIYCHGGNYVAGQILSLAVQTGAVPAEPGEFTKRAFLNGRIDLSQAEAVLDIINAESDAELQNAACILSGKLKETVEGIIRAIKLALAEIEARLDFPDEDIGEIPVDVVADTLKKELEKLQNLEATYAEGKHLKEQARVIICGRTNVGKSSILNRLAGSEKAIVSEQPMTTRDAVEAGVLIRGRSFVVVDTAGLAHKTPLNPDEKAVEKSEGLIRAASEEKSKSLVLLVLDASTPELRDEDLSALDLTEGTNRLIVFNKIDLSGVGSQYSVLRSHPSDEDVIQISALTGEGFKELEEAIYSFYDEKEEGPAVSLYITSARHHAEIVSAIEALTRTLECVENNEPPELTALEGVLALEALERITGEQIDGDILDIIFDKFCIGK